MPKQPKKPRDLSVEVAKMNESWFSDPFKLREKPVNRRKTDTPRRPAPGK